MSEGASEAGTQKPWDQWFWCASCDIEFKDPYAEIRENDLFPDQYIGQCAECGAMITRDVQPNDMDNDQTGCDAQ